MATKNKAPSKALTVIKILSRDKGATIPEIEKATGWKPHSCRAFLSGLRKKSSIGKEQRPDGAIAYRLAACADEVTA